MGKRKTRSWIWFVLANLTCIIFLSETLAPKPIIQKICRTIGFKDFICVLPTAGSQDLALLWNDDTHIQQRTFSSHHIDVVVGIPGKHALWRFTGIYGYAARGERSQTWNLIRSLAAENCTLPWLMAGDFNEILSNADKSGGLPRSQEALQAFRLAMTNAELSDMGFVGCQFTWFKKFTKERLNRGFHSMSWRDRFPFSRMITLDPNESDHSPLFVEVSPERKVNYHAKRLFYFEEIWHESPQCQNIIELEWNKHYSGNSMQQVAQKIQGTGIQLMEWHVVEFKKPNVEMKEIHRKLSDIMKLPYSPEQYEIQRELLHVKYSQLLTQQEKYWRQRSRVQWLKNGDRNSAFFHKKASNRRSRNLIKGLTNDEGDWVTSPNDIRQIIMQYFSGVFATDHTDFDAIDHITASTPMKVSEDMNATLL